MKVVILITGLSGSGKTTIAKGIQDLLGRSRVAVIDGDSTRHEHSKDLGFSRADRFQNLQRMATLASQRNEELSIVASIAPYADARAQFMKSVGGQKTVILVYNNTPLNICELRDPKGLYKKARAGEIQEFTGVSDPYEIPENADLEIDSSDSVEESIQKVILAFEKQTRKK